MTKTKMCTMKFQTRSIQMQSSGPNTRPTYLSSFSSLDASQTRVLSTEASSHHARCRCHRKIGREAYFHAFRYFQTSLCATKKYFGWLLGPNDEKSLLVKVGWMALVGYLLVECKPHETMDSKTEQ